MRTCIIALMLCAVSLTHAATWDLSLDVRAVQSDGRESYLDRGQGKFRYGDDDSGVHLGRLRAAWDQPLGEVFASHLEASSWGDDDRNPIDITEAYFEYRPYPRAGFRSRVRLGMFYPPQSLENRATGWETPYTLTPSAISSWIGEEVRTLGLEGQVDWLGTRTGHAFDLQLTATLFGWNDPAGVMIATHGFVFSDRQTALFGRSGEPRGADLTKQELFHEIDNRAGYSIGGQVRYLDRAVLNVLHYDNRGDPSVFRPALRDFAWNTTFDTAGVRVETGNGWTALVQWLDGRTAIAPPGLLLQWDFDSRSALLAKRIGPQLLSVRYDDFEVKLGAVRSDPGNEHGHAWTAAYSYDRGKQWRFVLEWLRVTSSVAARPVLLQEPALANETKVELSVRYALSGSF